jgi:threonine dehydrogenase-like Zn-dependent dehydrogenase
MYPTTKHELNELYNLIENARIDPLAKLTLVKHLKDVAESYVKHHTKVKYKGYIPGGY